MENWMEKYERRKDEQREKELNRQLEELLDILDGTFRDKERIKIIKQIIYVYEELKFDVCEYDEKDYMDKKKELDNIINKIKKQEYMESLESQSWNEYKEEEQIKDEEEDERE